MKKLLVILSMTGVVTPLGFVPQAVSADEITPTIIVKDGFVKIDYPAKYAGKAYTVEDGHYRYASGVLNARGDASFDLKTRSQFRTSAPDRVIFNMQGFKSPYSRNTNLAKEISGYRLMFKQNYNATEYFDLKSPTISSNESYVKAMLVQAGTVKRHSYSGSSLIKSDSTGSSLSFEFPQTTQATFSGTTRLTKALIYKKAEVGSTAAAPQDAQFVFNGKSYPGVVLR